MTKPQCVPRKRAGFTVVELLVVVTVIAVVIAILLPAVQYTREAGRRLQCVNNLKQIGLALHSYHDIHGQLPGGSIYQKHSWQSQLGSPTWAASVFPFLERQLLFDAMNLNKPISDSENQHVVTKVIPVFTCPTDPQANHPILKGRANSGTNNPAQSMGLWYPACIGPTHPDGCPFCPNPSSSSSNWCCQGSSFGTFNPPGNAVGMFGRHAGGFRFEEVTDGLSNTIMTGETLPGHSLFNGVYCTNFPVASLSIPPNTFLSDNGNVTTNTWCKTSGYKSLHPGGLNVLKGDGSVNFLKSTIDFRLYCNLGTRAGGEVVQVAP